MSGNACTLTRDSLDKVSSIVPAPVECTIQWRAAGDSLPSALAAPRGTSESTLLSPAQQEWISECNGGDSGFADVDGNAVAADDPLAVTCAHVPEGTVSRVACMQTRLRAGLSSAAGASGPVPPHDVFCCIRDVCARRPRASCSQRADICSGVRRQRAAASRGGRFGSVSTCRGAQRSDRLSWVLLRALACGALEPVEHVEVNTNLGNWGRSRLSGRIISISSFDVSWPDLCFASCVQSTITMSMYTRDQRSVIMCLGCAASSVEIQPRLEPPLLECTSHAR